jgi:hypothetical protein
VQGVSLPALVWQGFNTEVMSVQHTTKFGVVLIPAATENSVLFNFIATDF